MRSLLKSLLFLMLIVFTGQSAGPWATGQEPSLFPVSQQKTASELPLNGGYAEQPASILTTTNRQSAVSGIKLPPLSLPDKDSLSRPTTPTPAGAITTVLGSLAVVLGILFLLVWFTRHALPNAATGLPKEVIEVLGKAPLGVRQSMHLVRVGNKMILLSVTPNGAKTLTEITDRQEVDHLASLCQRSNPSSISQSFRNVLNQMGTKKNRDDLQKDIPLEDEEFNLSSQLSKSLTQGDV